MTADRTVLTVATTVATVEQASELARRILEAHLAACVQQEPGLLSSYRWQGQFCQEPEVRLVIKSLPGCEAPLQALFAEHHPYELPQFVAWTVDASEAYAAWVRSEVRLPG